jgi:hypothetical protein
MFQGRLNDGAPRHVRHELEPDSDARHWNLYGSNRGTALRAPHLHRLADFGNAQTAPPLFLQIGASGRSPNASRTSQAQPLTAPRTRSGA